MELTSPPSNDVCRSVRYINCLKDSVTPSNNPLGAVGTGVATGLLRRSLQDFSL